MFLLYSAYPEVVIYNRFQLGHYDGCLVSLHGRHSEGKGEGIWAQDGVRGREEGWNTCKDTTIFTIPLTNYVRNTTQLCASLAVK